MAVWKTSFAGNSYLGLFAKASDRLALIPKSSPPKFEEKAKGLGVEIAKTSVGGSPYLGVYFAMNSRGIVVPPFLTKQEISELKATGLEVMVVEDTRFCALGNNIACNDSGAVANPDMPKNVLDEISEALGVEVHARTIAGYKTVGMMAVATSKGWVGHNRMTDEDAVALEMIFKAKGRNTTVNSGAAMVGLGVVANSKSALCGENTTGFEVGRLEEGLDLIK